MAPFGRTPHIPTRPSPGFWQQQLPALVIPCLVPGCAFVLSRALTLELRGAERFFCGAGGLALPLRVLPAAAAKGSR